MARLRIRSRWDLLTVFPALLIAFAAVAVVFAPSSGPLSLAMVFEEQLFFVALVAFAVVALIARTPVTATGLAALFAVAAILFGGSWVSLPAPLPGAAASRTDITALTWNLEYGVSSPAERAAELDATQADVIALLELEPDSAEAIEADANLTARYTYRAMSPRKGPWGLGVLSRYPVDQIESTRTPACIELLVQTPRGPLRLIVGHPNHADIPTVTSVRVPVGYDASDRDSQIRTLRERIDRRLAAGERLLVLGDYNTSPSEATYGVLARGLKDLHNEVGEGPGWTWRPSRFAFLPIGFLRIDLQLYAGPIRAASTSIDCSLPGDHCRLFGSYEID